MGLKKELYGPLLLMPIIDYHNLKLSPALVNNGMPYIHIFFYLIVFFLLLIPTPIFITIYSLIYRCSSILLEFL